MHKDCTGKLTQRDVKISVSPLTSVAEVSGDVSLWSGQRDLVHPGVQIPQLPVTQFSAHCAQS